MLRAATNKVSPMTDLIYLRGLQVETLIGIHPRERQQKQPVRIDLELAAPTNAVASANSAAAPATAATSANSAAAPATAATSANSAAAPATAATSANSAAAPATAAASANRAAAPATAAASAHTAVTSGNITAAVSDQLNDTLDYEAVAQRITAFTEAAEYQLLEALAEGIAQLVIKEFRVPWLRLRLGKTERTRECQRSRCNN